jgi:deoxyribodipyrimidine photolyase-related protein
MPSTNAPVATLRLVLGDQLTRRIASLVEVDPENDMVLMVEVGDEAVYVPHHKQKLVFTFSAMRHFADSLEQEGLRVHYVRLDAEGNSGSFSGEVARAVERFSPQRIVVTEPGEWRVQEMMHAWRDALPVPVEILPDNRFLCSRLEFARWAEGRKSLRMEFFYREMRRKTGFLMEGGEPVGGQWNFDHDNRKSLPKNLPLPEHPRFAPDPTTREVIAMVAERFGSHFGDLEPFGWAVTRADALKVLAAFIEERLERFGDYQDAMKAGAPFLFHATISPYLNAGLLTAEEVCIAAERAWSQGRAPINAVEGFIRQIIGWREYVRGIYWLHMPQYATSNHLDAHRRLPDFYWTGETDMACLRECVGDTRRNAYANHIQRLMVLGNFALLAGIEPAEVEEWYLLVYADAYEWVELPNVHGMVLFADGGVLGSKPYAASGAYIDRMSDYCAGCRYDVKAKLGERACPFNYLYWNFHIANEERIGKNPRLAMPFRTLAKMPSERRAQIVADSEAFLDRIGATLSA